MLLLVATYGMHNGGKIELIGFAHCTGYTGFRMNWKTKHHLAKCLYIGFYRGSILLCGRHCAFCIPGIKPTIPSFLESRICAQSFVLHFVIWCGSIRVYRFVCAGCFVVSLWLYLLFCSRVGGLGVQIVEVERKECELFRLLPLCLFVCLIDNLLWLFWCRGIETETQLNLTWFVPGTNVIRSNDLSTKLTPISSTIASIILPMTVMKSNTFHGSLKKFCVEQANKFKKC